VRRLAVLLAVTVLAAPAAAAAPGKLHVVLKGQDHTPHVGKKWHYDVTVRNAAGKPVASRIHLQFLLGTFPVGEVGVHVVKNGRWSETFGTPGNPAFPASARGQSLVLQATVTAKGYATAKARWPINVR
jgi:hypothetical protein